MSDLEQAMQQLWKTHRVEVVSMVEELIELCGAVGDVPDSDRVQRTQVLAHRLVGVGAVFGYAELCTLATALETLALEPQHASQVADCHALVLQLPAVIPATTTDSV